MIRSTKLKPVDIPVDETISEKIKQLEELKHQKELINESKREHEDSKKKEIISKTHDHSRANKDLKSLKHTDSPTNQKSK